MVEVRVEIRVAILRDSLSNALGIAWDLELESYRRGVGSEGEIRAVNI
jgi:hypothetical protein